MHWERIIKVLEREDLELVTEPDANITNDTTNDTDSGGIPVDDTDLGEKNRKPTHCKCEVTVCKNEAIWKCTRCRSQMCTTHKNRAESYEVGPSRRGSDHVHNYRRWKCDPKNPQGRGNFQ